MTEAPSALVHGRISPTPVISVTGHVHNVTCVHIIVEVNAGVLNSHCVSGVSARGDSPAAGTKHQTSKCGNVGVGRLNESSWMSGGMCRGSVRPESV